MVATYRPKYDTEITVSNTFDMSTPVKFCILYTLLKWDREARRRKAHLNILQAIADLRQNYETGEKHGARHSLHRTPSARLKARVRKIYNM